SRPSLSVLPFALPFRSPNTNTGRHQIRFPNIGRKHPIHAIDVPKLPRLLGVVVLFADTVVYFYLGAALESAQDLIAAGDNFLSFREAPKNFHISGALNSGRNRLEIHLFRGLINYKNALNFLLALRIRRTTLRRVSFHAGALFPR